MPTLYVTFGLLKWFDSPDSQVQILSPLLLFPVEMERENVESPWEMRLQDEEVVHNHSLVQLMSNDFAIRFPELPDDHDSDSPTWRLRYFVAIQNAIRHLTNWEVVDECTLGIFSFQKIAMWDDLGKNQDQIAEHDLCRAVAGDQSVRLKAPDGLPKSRDLDAVAHPARTYHILDSDSSQHEAIEAVKRGANLVLDGPPGTGKSQTIANIIAEFLAMGKSVLFVSEKAAALEVVKQRLDQQKLGDFCLEVHSHKSNKKQVIDELGRCLCLPGETYNDHSDDLNRLFEIRKSLNAYALALHEVRQPLGLSPFQVHGRLAGIRTVGVSRIRIRDVSEMTGDQVRRISELLDALLDCRNVVQNHAAHPWRGSVGQRDSLNLINEIEHHFERLALGLRQLRDVAPMLGSLGFAPDEPSIPEWLNAVELIKDVPNYPLVPAEWFQRNPRLIARDFVQLDQLTLSYRETREALPEFSEEAILRLQADAVKTLSHQMDSVEASLRAHDHTTINTLSGHLRRVANAVRELTEQVKALTEAWNRVLLVLGVKPLPLFGRDLGMVEEILGLIGKVSPLRRSWLDTEGRQVILEVLDKTQRALPEFSEVALLRLVSDPEGLSRLTTITASGSPGLQIDESATVVVLRDKLESVAQLFRTISRCHADTQSSLRNVLAALGLTPRPLLMRGLGKVQEILERVGTVSPIRRSWLDVERRQVIRELLDRTQTHLPEFSEVAVLRLVSDPEALARLASITVNGPPGLQSDECATVATLRDRLDSAAQSLAILSRRLAETQSALLNVLAALGLTPRPLLMRGLGKVQEIFDLVGTASPIHRSWLDVERRREIFGILDRLREDEDKNIQSRLNLMKRMLPIAFDGNYASLVSKCRSYRAVWRRVMPDWWIHRSRLARLYTRELPDTAILMDDLRELTEYHRRNEFARQLKREYSEKLVLGKDGEPDRERTVAGLRASERFDVLIRVFPELKEILVDQSRVDRDAIRTSLETFSSCYRILREAVAQAGNHLDLGMVLNADGNLAKMSVDEFAKWIDVQTSSFLERLADLNRVCLLLKPGCDLPRSEVPARLASIAALRQSDLWQPEDHLATREDGELDRERTIAGLRSSEQFDPLIRVSQS